MKIEDYLSTEYFVTRRELENRTGLSDRQVRAEISKLKETVPVISHSKGKGYRLAKDFQDFNTANEAKQELEEIVHCINEIKSRKRSLDKTKRTYELYVKKLKNNILFLENESHFTI